MTKIDFYILTNDERLPFVCRLLEKAYKSRHRIYIHTENQADAHAIDELLWTYRDDSFLPHNLIGEGPEPAPPIQIGYQTIPNAHKDILINLHTSAPDFYKQFNRVLEIIPNNAALQQTARDRYSFYQTNACQLTTHKIDA